MKVRFTILALAVGLSSVTAFGQSIKDYFIPDSSYNKASFYKPDKSGARTGMTRTIYYTKIGATYNILDAIMFNGQPAAIQTRIVTFTTNEVQMTKSVSTTMFETNKKDSYIPARVILKMPPAGQTTSWTYIEISGDNIKCTASWTTLTVDGSQKKTIKVVKVNEFEGKIFKTIEYYVKGIGLWKTEMQGSDGKTQITYKFDNLEYEPTEK